MLREEERYRIASSEILTQTNTFLVILEKKTKVECIRRKEPNKNEFSPCSLICRMEKHKKLQLPFASFISVATNNRGNKFDIFLYAAKWCAGFVIIYCWSEIPAARSSRGNSSERSMLAGVCFMRRDTVAFCNMKLLQSSSLKMFNGFMQRVFMRRETVADSVSLCSVKWSK